MIREDIAQESTASSSLIEKYQCPLEAFVEDEISPSTATDSNCSNDKLTMSTNCVTEKALSDILLFMC